MTNEIKEPPPLYTRFGSSNLSVNAFINAYLKSNPPTPIWLWCEPKVGKKYNNFCGLHNVSKIKDFTFQNTPLVESRLFWDNSMLHIIESESNQCKIFECSEQTLNDPIYIVQFEDQKPYCKNTYEVYFRIIKDYDRFGIEKPDNEKVKIIEYLYPTNGKVFTWRLKPIPDSKEEGKCLLEKS